MPDWLYEIPVGFWDVLTEMAPYLLFGFFVAGVLSVALSPRFVERHLGGRGLAPVLKAAVFGVPLPLCSCGVIPVSASLRRHGASRAATTSFLIATPQDGVDSVLVTFSLLGGVFAIFRPIVALLSGVIGGLLVSLLGGDKGDADAPANRPPEQDPPAIGGAWLGRALAYGFGDLPRDIGWALLIGLAVAAMISAAVPKDYFAPYLGGGIGAMLIMMMLGVPVYVCATASVPIAAALILKGVSPGAALVFLMTGPATNAATISTVWKVMGRRTAMIYLATVAGSALAAGLVLDYIFHGAGTSPAPGMAWMLPPTVKAASAVALLAILAWALVSPMLARRKGATAMSEQTSGQRLKISGMTCTHCAASVRRALLECAGVVSARVDLDSGLAEVAGEGIDPAQLAAAVKAVGYEAKLLNAESAENAGEEDG